MVIAERHLLNHARQLGKMICEQPFYLVPQSGIVKPWLVVVISRLHMVCAHVFSLGLATLAMYAKCGADTGQALF
jgi:hypothetical protein